jgi:uncharacterized protein YkwD
MNKYLPFLFFVLQVSLTEAQPSASGPLHATEQEVLDAINLVRTQPKHVLKDLLPRWLDSTKTENNLFVRSLIREMESYPGGPPLVRDARLDSIAADHARVMGASGKTGHSQGPGKEFSRRTQHLLNAGIEAAESLQYGYEKGIDIVFDLLIDEGVNGTGHRKQILNRNYTCIGIAVYPHRSDYGINTVIESTTPLPAQRTGK